MKSGNGFDYLAMIILVLGGINMGIMGFFDDSVINRIFGTLSAMSRTIYAIIGLSALYIVIKAIVKAVKYLNSRMGSTRQESA